MADPFVVNVADTPALRYPEGGVFAGFESRDERFPDFGINIHVIEPGEPSAKYHAESVQEDFLVLAGRCMVILNGEEPELPGQRDRGAVRRIEPGVHRQLERGLLGLEQGVRGDEAALATGVMSVVRSTRRG